MQFTKEFPLPGFIALGVHELGTSVINISAVQEGSGYTSLAGSTSNKGKQSEQKIVFVVFLFTLSHTHLGPARLLCEAVLFLRPFLYLAPRRHSMFVDYVILFVLPGSHKIDASECLQMVSFLFLFRQLLVWRFQRSLHLKVIRLWAC